MTSSKLRSVIVNILGGFGYLFCLMQWVWAAIIFLPPLLDSDLMQQFIQKPVVQEPIAAQPAEISTAGILFAVGVVIVMIILTIYVIIKMPATVGKTGSKITHKATAIALPIIMNHKKVPKKKRLRLTARLLFITKITLSLIPFCLIYFIDNQDTNLDRDVVVIIAAISAFCAIGLFFVQAASAKLLRVDYKTVW